MTERKEVEIRTVNINELTGPELRKAVALALGWKVERDDAGRGPWICWQQNRVVASFSEHGFAPDIKWEHGGPIIERERISLHPPAADDGLWSAMAGPRWAGHLLAFNGATPLIAAMRAFVASKTGG